MDGEDYCFDIGASKLLNNSITSPTKIGKCPSFYLDHDMSSTFCTSVPYIDRQFLGGDEQSPPIFPHQLTLSQGMSLHCL